MKPELYIPPCCIHKQLPDLIRSGGQFAVFYSQGDWGLPKLTFAVECLVPSHISPVVTILVMPDITIDNVRYFESELNRHDSEAIILVTSTDQTAFLKDNLKPEHLARFTYCPSRKEAETNNLWIRWSSNSSLSILGPILPSDEMPRRVCQYTSHFIADSADFGTPAAEQHCSALTSPSPTLLQAFAPWRSIIRLHASIRSKHPLISLWLSNK